jgi:hypothetical protein
MIAPENMGVGALARVGVGVASTTGHVEARHRDWFWKGLQGNRTASSLLHY